MRYSISGNQNGYSTLIVYDNGSTDSVPSNHPLIDQIHAALRGGATEQTVRELVSTIQSVGKQLIKLTDRVSLRGRKLYFDNDRIRGALVKHIVRCFQGHDERTAHALVQFLEKVQTNPNVHSRDSLYRWLDDRVFTITLDGDFIAYKGVTSLNRLSSSTGNAIVNGVRYRNTQIPNPDSAVVEMPRSEVEFDPFMGCAYGLHVGTWDYAVNFPSYGTPTLAVLVNPRDVVSVPTDCDAQKMRVCRYQVLAEVSDPITEPIVDEDDLSRQLLRAEFESA